VAVIPPGPESVRSYETDSTTTLWPPGHLNVERGVTVKLPVVWPCDTGNRPFWLTEIDSCLFAACGLLPLFV
jgi:hypothetical protein